MTSSSSKSSPSVSLTPASTSFQNPICLVPGSKSYTIRALLLAALTPGNVILVNPLDSDDTQAMKACLEALGILITEKVVNQQLQWSVSGSITDISDKNATLNCNLSAASIRFLMAFCILLPGEQILLGEHGLNQRPVKDLVDSLHALGASIQYLDKEGYPPVQIGESKFSADAHNISIDASTSSQYTSALMMIAPELSRCLEKDITLNLKQTPISQPYLEMTQSIMADFGVTVASNDPCHYQIAKGQAYQISRYAIETDASSMSYFLAIAALTQSTLTIANVKKDSVQADMALISILERMGNRFEFRDGNLTIAGSGVQALSEVDMESCPDQAQTIAVLAAFAPGKTHITGLQSLRVKETDRLKAVATELTKMGISVIEAPDAITIHGGNPKPTSIATYGDHRMAMSFAVAGSVLPGLVIEDSPVVGKTYPTFWEDLRKIGMDVEVLHNEVLTS